ncbi:MAG: cell division protein FtsZ [Thermodesulfovibrionales bacterium]|nr:cell division protein FtsZ [Thermodesulfovibrionales bacterium]
MFELEQAERTIAKIKVIGVGGGGCNAVNSMLSSSLFGVEFIAVNTDLQHLEMSLAPIKVQIGAELTKGLGAGANPVIGKQAAIEDKDSLTACIEGADMVFITAGMGGGTGTGASPVIASLAKELKVLTIAVVTKPFYYEGRKRALQAEDGINELKRYVDTLIVLPNDNIHKIVEKGTPLIKSFAIANDVLRSAIQGISDVILSPGFINLDFADLKTVMENAGKAVIGVGRGKGQDAAIEAAKKAISNPLLEDSSIEDAKNILLNITGGFNLSHNDVQVIAEHIHNSVHEEANIILGTVLNPEMEDEISVTVIATGMESKKTIILPKDNIKTWHPQKQTTTVSGTSTILSKKLPLQSIIEQQNVIIPTETKKEPPIEKPLSQEPSTIEEDEDLDIPTFMRKKG